VAATREQLSDAEFKAVEQLLTFCREQGFEISWGTGQKLGSFKVRVPGIGRRTLFCVYANGRVSWYFGYLDEDDRLRRFRDELAERLISEFQAEFPPDLEKRFPAISIEKWAGRPGQLQSFLSELIEEHRKAQRER
jgi:hypothetical protein